MSQKIRMHNSVVQASYKRGCAVQKLPKETKGLNAKEERISLNARAELHSTTAENGRILPVERATVSKPNVQKTKAQSDL